MADRWSWDFEDEQKARRAGGETPKAERPHSDGPAAPGPAGPTRGGPPDKHRFEIRRRRAAAGVALLVLVIVIVVALASGSGNGKNATSKRLATRPHVVKRPPVDTEEDQFAAVKKVLSYTPFVKEGGTQGRDIALTFDDGPGPYTPQVLSVLERHHVKATFFVIGKMLRYFSASTVKEIEDGDAIGDHTETHPMLAHLSAHDQYEELFEQIARVELLGGRRPVLFRPPYGSFNATTLRELGKLHLLMILWSVDTDDYLQPGVDVIVERALAEAHPGEIILMHDAGGVRTQTIEALPLIIKGLRAKGFHLVTVPRLLLADPPPAGQPIPPNLSGD
ncbi:MAG TPA: polysaccharide deacetylase family protein [Solirubrobacteraceae bacterium]|jgi:peptidoglycan/xylan/chitin deacetylase (PgdA/CDA1 family)|nr:polysaccharide deacetylase family protein [Solirubrobacteraceae bacterium]